MLFWAGNGCCAGGASRVDRISENSHALLHKEGYFAGGASWGTYRISGKSNAFIIRRATLGHSGCQNLGESPCYSA